MPSKQRLFTGCIFYGTNINQLFYKTIYKLANYGKITVSYLN